MSERMTDWRGAVCALLVLLVACQAQETGEANGGEASQAATSTEAVSEAESMADEASEPEPELESEADTMAAEAARAGETSRDTASAEAQEEVPMERRQVFLVEFKDPYSEGDLTWLREYGARVMSENNERSVTVWFVPRKEHAWATDERIARVTPMRR